MSALSSIVTCAWILVLLFFLAALGRGLGVLAPSCSSPVVRAVLILLGLIVGLVILGGVRIVAQLVAIAKIGDHLARQPRKGGLIGQHMVKVPAYRPPVPRQSRARGRRHVRPISAVAPRRHLPDQIPCGHRQGHLGGGDLAIALAVGLMAILASMFPAVPGMVAGAHRLAAGILHRLVNLARQRARSAHSGRPSRRRDTCAAAQRHPPCRAPAAPRRASSGG
jgi:hypothetical protein